MVPRAELKILPQLLLAPLLAQVLDRDRRAVPTRPPPARAHDSASRPTRVTALTTVR